MILLVTDLLVVSFITGNENDSNHGDSEEDDDDDDDDGDRYYRDDDELDDADDAVVATCTATSRVLSLLRMTRTIKKTGAQRTTAMILIGMFLFSVPSSSSPLLPVFSCGFSWQVQKVEKIVHNPVDLEALHGHCTGF